MMADKRAFKTLAASMERRANELLDYVKLPEGTDRGVKGKKDKLSKDIDSLDEIVGRCVDASIGTSEEVLKKQQDVITKVEKALEGAEDFFALEDYRRDIATKELEVACVCQSVSSRMEQFKARVAKLSLNDESRIVMSTELDELAVMIKEGLEKNKSLMLNNVANREKYQTNQTKLDGFSGEIVAQNMTTAGYYSHPGQHFISSGYGTSIDRGIVSPPYVTSGYNSQFLSQPVSKVQIQKIKPPIFDGDISKYPAWKKRWKELISPGSNSECEELYRMQDAMGPKILAETIKSFQTLGEAWTYLEDQYGRADIAAVKLIKDLKNLNLGKLSDHEKFMEMYRHFRVLATHLNEIGQLNALNSLTELNLVIAKLPGDIKTRYAEFKSRHNYLTGFALLSFFMEEQAKVSRECCVTIHASSGANDKVGIKCYNCNESGHISKNCPTQRSKGKLRINGLSSKSISCGLCQVPHRVDEGKNKRKFKTRLSACDQFRSMSVNERAQVLADVGGCVKCTDWQHSSKDCDAVYGNRKWQPCSVKDSNSSSRCGKDHHNLLHGASHAYVCKINACPVYDTSCSVVDLTELVEGFCGCSC